MDLLSADALLTLLTLTGLEIVLGVDNVVFIALLIQKLPAHRQARIRSIGILFALFLRIAMLFAATTIAKMTNPLFMLMDLAISWRDILLFLGGIFLVYKGIKELIDMRPDSKTVAIITPRETMMAVILQVVMIDFILSFDSIITAVGITTELTVMVIAVIIAMIVMLFSVQPIGKFIERYPRIRLIAICFIMLIGVYLMASGMHYEIAKAYLYSAMGFALMVEITAIILRLETPAASLAREI